MTPTEFLNTLAPLAIQARRDGSPLFPSVRLAQNGLETGWKINPHNNLGGFKVGSGTPNEWWRGDTYTTSTWEVINGKKIQTTAVWRSYASVYDFYRDQDRLFQNARYAPVRAARTPEEQCDALQASGYATDPAYASKLKAIIKNYNLTRYDREAEEMTAEEKKAFEALQKDVAELKKIIEAQVKLVPAPEWFVKEFGSADLNGLILDPKMTLEGWRSLAISLRAQGFGSGKRLFSDEPSS